MKKSVKKSISDFESKKLGNYMKVYGSKSLALETITKTLDTVCVGCDNPNDGGGSDNDGCDDC